jgi:hypothetical protein
MPFGTVLDTFDRANEGSPPSSSWTDAWADASGGLRVVSNSCRMSTSGFARDSSYWNTTFGPNCEVFATMSVKDSFGDGDPALGLRLVDMGASTDGYFLGIDRSGSSVHQIVRLDNGTGTALGANISLVWSAGDSFGFEAIGPILKAYHKPSGGRWAVFAVREDATYTAAGKIGLAISGTNTDAEVNDFGGGTVVFPPDYSSFPKAILRRSA